MKYLSRVSHIYLHMQLSICMLVLIMLYNSQYALPNTTLTIYLAVHNNYDSIRIYIRGQYTRNVHKMRPHVFKRGTKPWHTCYRDITTYRDGRKVEVGYSIKPTVSRTYCGCESHGSSLWTSRKIPSARHIRLGGADSLLFPPKRRH